MKRIFILLTFALVWSYSVLQGKWCWHFREHKETICDQYLTNTIEIK